RNQGDRRQDGGRRGSPQGHHAAAAYRALRPALMSRRQRLTGLLLGFAGMCLFAGTLPATRLAVRGLDPLFLTAARATLAGSAALIVLVATQRRPLPRKLWPEMAAAAFCTVLGFPLLAALGMMTVPA